ncbi:MAG: SGNH/GDSL hydrolase family protein [Planctomycetaceae bacterium]|nr:SGNH/GDSL hydrolase family protein [Planctomycetaceae bacterium]
MLRLLTVWCLLLNGTAFFLQAQEVPEATLPKVVLLGDSIRLSYTSTVKQELAGQAIIVSPKPNGQDSRNLLKHLEAWAIKQQPDVVHFNCGIHDTKKFKATGKFQVSPAEYEANLRQIVKRLRDGTEAKIIFATSTPILDDRAAEVRADRDYELLNASIEQYNSIAKKVMRELKVPVNDLHAALSKPMSPATTESLIVNDGVHLTPAGQLLLGRQVARKIQSTWKENSK